MWDKSRLSGTSLDYEGQFSILRDKSVLCRTIIFYFTVLNLSRLSKNFNSFNGILIIFFIKS